MWCGFATLRKLYYSITNKIGCTVQETRDERCFFCVLVRHKSLDLTRDLNSCDCYSRLWRGWENFFNFKTLDRHQRQQETLCLIPGARGIQNIYHTWAAFVSNIQLSYKGYRYLSHLGSFCIQYPAELQGIQISLTLLTFVSNTQMSYKGYKYLLHF